MTNDFVLFPDADTGDGELDADVALITAYLSRELSPVQIAAVEDRLDSDRSFRERVRPIIETWTVRGSLRPRKMAPGTAVPAPTSSLTAAEIESGWLRHVTSPRETNTPAHTLRLQEEEPTPRARRIPLARVAAVLAMTFVPMFALAQVVKYVASHSGAPGHEIAKRITRTLAPLGGEPSERELVLGQGQQAVPIVDLPPASARTTQTFGAILGLKHTSDGRVLVNDALRRLVYLFENNLAKSTLVFDSVPGTSKSYGMVDSLNPMSRRILFPHTGDSSVFGPVHGTGRASALVLDANGSVARVIDLGSGGVLLMMNGPAFWDPTGHLLYTASATLAGQMFVVTKPGAGNSTVPMRPDSLRVHRLLDLGPTGPGGMQVGRNIRADTLGTFLRPEDQRPRIAGPPFNLQGVGNGGGKLVPVTGPDGVVCMYNQATRRGPSGCTNTAKQIVNPLYVADDWAMLSDGTVAFVRGTDYHVDWVHPNGTKSSTGRLPFGWRKLTDADKQRIVDSTRAAIDSLDALAVAIDEQLKPWKDSVTRAARAAGAMLVNTELEHPGPPVRIWPYEIVPLSQIPDSNPPIRAGAAKPDADGNLWILTRTTTLSRQGELVYDVVNPTRGLAQRVRLPAGRSIAGFGKGGVVYLQYGDMKTGFILERSTLPAPIPK